MTPGKSLLSPGSGLFLLNGAGSRICEGLIALSVGRVGEGVAYLLSRSCSVLGSGSPRVSGRRTVMGQAATRTAP